MLCYVYVGLYPGIAHGEELEGMCQVRNVRQNSLISTEFLVTIKFTSEWSNDSITYLELLVKRNAKALQTDLCTEPSVNYGTFTDLLSTTAHLRIRRKVSEEDKCGAKSGELVG